MKRWNVIFSILKDMSAKCSEINWTPWLLLPNERIDSLWNIHFLPQKNLPKILSVYFTTLVISDGVIQYPIPLFAESSILVRSRFSSLMSLLDMDPLVLMMLFFWQILHIWWLTQHFENVLISFFVLLKSTRLRDILVFRLYLKIDKNWVLLY